MIEYLIHLLIKEAITHPKSPVDEVIGQNFKVGLLLTGVSALHDVIGDLTASIVLWGVPGQVAWFCLDVWDYNVSRRKRAVWKCMVGLM